MTSKKLRSGFLKFFEKKGHKIVPSSSLLPTDPSVLFTTAGMQQFKEYFLGKKSPYGNKVTSCQKCFRTSDIETVGDESHLTFLEMLGNFSFGDYFKKETIEWTFKFLTEVLEISTDRIAITVFDGDDKIPFDEESYEAWLKFLPEEQIKKGSREDNVWGPAGAEGPCGAANEVYIDGLEVATLVFMEYFCAKDGSLAPLLQKGVDVGWGLERVAMIVQKKPSVFETDLFLPITAEIPGQNERARRIIADHIKGAVFLTGEGVFPSNVEQGYVLRRILRRAMRFGELLGFPKYFLIPLAKKVIEIYQDVYPGVKSKEADILTIIQKEEEKFSKTLARGLKQFEKIASLGDIAGIDAFHLFDTYGFPLEVTEELAREKGLKIDKRGFEEAFKKHREISRAGVEKKFGGVGTGIKVESAKLHTATHLLHSALRKVLGSHVKQMGSDITPSRLRFDFSHPQKMTEAEIKKVETLVNQKIKEDLEVKKTEMSLDDALKSEALAFFKEQYPEKVTVYSITELPKEANRRDKSLLYPSLRLGQVKKRTKSSSPEVFSEEICAGPHIKKTGELGRFKIVKEESSGAGVRRIRAILE